MAAHHRQGVEIAGIGGDKAGDPHLRALARMMAAGQNGEIAILAQWWRSWFAGEVPDATPDEHRRMLGMIATDDIVRLGKAQPADFDRLFNLAHVGAPSGRHRQGLRRVDESWGSAAQADVLLDRV